MDPLTIDVSKVSNQEYLAALLEISADQNVRLCASATAKNDGIGAGIEKQATFSVEAPVGDFAFMLAENATFDIDGDVGHACGHSLVSGRINVKGSAKDGLGSFASGGFVSVLGTAGNRCGLGLCGGDIFVRSTVGNQAGHSMSSGTLVLGNGAGELLGVGMTGGIIYVRGEVKSAAAGVQKIRMKDPDFMRLSLLLARAGIKSDGKDFKAYKSKAAAL